MTSVGTVLSYPIPAYQNVTIEDQFYQPSRFIISAITRGQQTTITTSVAHNYVVGQLVRFIIPPSFGTRGLNEQQGYVVSLPSTTQVLVDISSLGMDAYIASSATTVAQILAIGNGNSGAINATGRTNTGTFVPGSFINISPL